MACSKDFLTANFSPPVSGVRNYVLSPRLLLALLVCVIILLLYRNLWSILRACLDFMGQTAKSEMALAGPEAGAPGFDMVPRREKDRCHFFFLYVLFFCNFSISTFFKSHCMS